MPRPKVDNHKTAIVILRSAKKHFLQKGFDGTSIGEIADEAHINKSLIYHHFGSKEKLWKSVKEEILKSTRDVNFDRTDFTKGTFKEFIKNFVTFRFQVYARNPDLIRLMHWQRLESHNALVGLPNNNFALYHNYILECQQRAEIRSDMPSEMILYLILSMPVNGFLDRASFLSTKMGQAHYLSYIIDSLLAILSPQS
ncbi:MAG: TetR/AcrR family transcriptional regulator [Alphaproteobacteria bacterium]|nr:TetR/AcrR family transcriptional regulator [Alphaproteobacteria bacterium]